MSVTSTIAKWATPSDPYLNRVDPNTALDALEAFAQSRNITATRDTLAETVDKHTLWEAIRDNDPTLAPIRDAFEFDREVAFDNFGVQRAQKLLSNLQVIKVIIKSNGDEAEVPVRAMVSVRPDDGSKRVMMNREYVLDNQEYREQLVNAKWDRLESWCKEVVDLEEFTLSSISEFLKSRVHR